MESEQVLLLENKLHVAENHIHQLEKITLYQTSQLNTLQEENLNLKALTETQKTSLQTKQFESIAYETKIHSYERRIEELEIQIMELAENNKKNIENLFSEYRLDEDDVLKLIKERDLLKTETDELRASILIQKNLLENLEKTLESYKENSMKKDLDLQETQERFYKEMQEFKVKNNDLCLENNHLKQIISNLKEEIASKEEFINNKDFEIKNLEFKIKEDELNVYRNNLELKASLENYELKLQEKSFENQELKEKMESLDSKYKEREQIFEEKISGLERNLQETFQLLEEKKIEITKLYSQFQSGINQKYNIESLRLPYRI